MGSLDSSSPESPHANPVQSTLAPSQNPPRTSPLWEVPTKVTIASIEAKRTTSETFRAYTKTPAGKFDHIGSQFKREPYVVSHPDKASAGGHSPAGGHLEATAQGRRAHVKLDLKEGAKGYVCTFYEGKASETMWYTHQDGAVKICLPPDSGGKRMGAVAGVVGEGYVKL